MNEIFELLKEFLPFVLGGGLGSFVTLKYTRKGEKAKSIMEDLRAHKEIIDSLEERIEKLLARQKQMEGNCEKCQFRKQNTLPIYAGQNNNTA